MENVAFRGFSAVTPENTLTAFRRAEQAGCHRIGSELRLSRDGRAFCFADPSLHRLTGSHGWFHRLSSFEVRMRELPYGGQARRVERIPSLDELLSFASESNVGLQLELPAGSSPRWRGIIASTVETLLESLKPWVGKLDLQLCSEDRRVVKGLLDQGHWPVGAIVSRFSDGMAFLQDEKLAFLRADRGLFIPPRRRKKGDPILLGGSNLLKTCRAGGRRFYIGPVRKTPEMALLASLEPSGLLSPGTAQLSALGYRRES